MNGLTMSFLDELEKIALQDTKQPSKKMGLGKKLLIGAAGVGSAALLGRQLMRRKAFRGIDKALSQGMGKVTDKIPRGV